MTAPVLSVKTANGRYYCHPGKKHLVPSITNIKGKKNIEGLKYWAANEAARYASQNVAKLAGLSEDEIYRLVKSAPFSNDSSRAESAAVGDLVHAWIDGYIKGAPPGAATVAEAAPSARGMWRQFLGVVERYKPQWQDSEFTVWSDTYGYAGTGDWSAYIGGMLVLGDTKTGKSLYPDMGMQLAALANADFILDGDGTERPLPAFGRLALLHIRPTFARLVPVDHVDESFNQFLALKKVFDFDVEYADKVLQFAPKIETRADYALAA